MYRLVRRTLWRLATRERLWNGNHERLTNLFSMDPERNLWLWSFQRHELYRRRFESAIEDPAHSEIDFVRLSETRQITAFIERAQCCESTTPDR